MNIEKLQQIADHIKTIKQKDFNMADLFKCIIGHSYKAFGDKRGNVLDWFYEFIEAEGGYNTSRYLRLYIVHGGWEYVDNSVEGAVKRIEHVIAWLESPVRDENYFKNIMHETFPNSF